MSAHAQRVRSRFDHEAKNWNAQYQNANHHSIYAHNLLLRQQQTQMFVAHVHGRILELGCGAGNVLLNVSSDNPIKSFGADFSFGMLTQAQHNANQLKQNLPLLNADATQLPLASNSFETIICLGVLEYIPNFSDVLSECMRILKPKGQLIVSIPNATSPFIRIDDTVFAIKNAITHTLLPTRLRIWVKQKLFGRKEKPYFKHKKQRFSPKVFHSQLLHHGFQITDQKFHTYGFGIFEGFAWNVRLSKFITRQTLNHPHLEQMGWTHILKAVKP